MRIKFPTGATSEELRYYMGADWPEEKDELGQQLLQKCNEGKVIELDRAEAERLLEEVDHALDIKHDHVGDEGWTGSQQYYLEQFREKLRAALSKRE